MISRRILLGVFLFGVLSMALGGASLHFLYAAWRHAGF